ncbi:hypothetical protein K9F62_10405 [Desulfovibrio sp. JY]|nr:hypothetical protein K9F62_10405 [Desulfovibrio sp. JY]
MADKRKPEGRITIESPTSRVAIELFPARLFPGGERLDGQYRVRVGRSWWRSANQKYVFLTYAELFVLLMEMSEKLSGVPAQRQDDPRPDVGRGDRRRLLLGRGDDGAALYEAVVVMTDPMQGLDGRWQVFLVGRREPVLVDDLERYEGVAWARNAR